MEIRETSLSFPVARGSGPMAANRTIVFPRQVVSAVAAVRGYQVGFSGDDHHVGLLEVALDTAVDQNTVTVAGRLGCRDWSGNWDDDYGGTIQVSLLAELVSATEPPPGGTSSSPTWRPTRPPSTSTRASTSTRRTSARTTRSR